MCRQRVGSWGSCRGSTLIIVLGVVAIILTIIVMLFSAQDSTRQARLRSHNELLARQKIQFELARIANPTNAAPAPSWLQIDLKKELDQSNFLGTTFGSKPFVEFANLLAPTPLPQASRAAAYPGYRYLEYRLPTQSQTFAVVSENLPFAAMSFASSETNSLSFESVRAWKNPILGDSADPATEYTATPPYLLAAGAVEIDDFPYGFIFQGGARSSPVRLGNSETTAVAYSADDSFKGVVGVDPASYRNLLERQLSTAFQSLSSAAANSDRTLLITDEVSIENSLSMFFSQAAAPQNMKDRLSLRGSQGYWLPTVPTLKKQFFVLWHFIFHVPASPDGGLDEVSRLARSVISGVLDLLAQLEKAKQALQDAENALSDAEQAVNDACGCHWTSPWCCPVVWAAEAGLEIAKLGLKAAELAVSTLESAIMVAISPVTDLMEAVLAAEGQVPPPNTRNKEKTFQSDTGVQFDKTGMEAWAYRAIFDSIVDIASDMFSGRFSKIAQDMGHEVNVVFFGQGDKVQQFNFDDPFVSRATWNVPKGRTFYYNGAMSIYGDLWLGRGSCFVVTGDLKMNAGDAPSGTGQAPGGTVFLEEGASLVVQGSFTGAGDATHGSVMLGGPMGAVHGISSAILVQGDATFPHGVVPGVPLDRIKGVGGDGKVSDNLVAMSHDLFVPLLSDLGPNLAKVAGPFHTRLPYIARFATTIELISLEEIEIPFVMPMNFPNFHVLVFRGLSMLYAPTLNFELGENLFTHTDWWGKGGEGKSPVIRKAAAVRLAQSTLANSSYSLSTSSSDATTAISQRKSEIGSSEVEKFSNDLVLQLLAQWAQAISAGTGIPLLSWGTVANNILSQIANNYYNLDNRASKLDGQVPKGLDDLANKMAAIWLEIEQNDDSMTPTEANRVEECPGALIYANGNLTVGSVDNQGLRTPLSVGFFLAGGRVTLESEITVGSAVSLEHAVQGQTLLYYPPFTQASLYVPQTESLNWMDRAADTSYGPQRSDSRTSATASLPIGLFQPRLKTEIWSAP